MHIIGNCSTTMEDKICARNTRYRHKQKYKLKNLPESKCVRRENSFDVFLPPNLQSKKLNSGNPKRAQSIPTLNYTCPQFLEFVQPARLFRTNLDGAVPSVFRTRDITRDTQIHPRTDSPKSNKKDGKPRQSILEPPSQAQIYPNNRHSNFFPWKGGHPEDFVSDSQARNGQYDRLYVGKGHILPSGLPSRTHLVLTALQNEQTSARLAFSSAFKQRGGLSILSSLCRTTLVRRQSRSQVAINSTFKPPPRVTLPDPRRESWLRDLANPLVSLRRLARTIPHGMKGPALLEQCSAKNIPVERAVWFVRCVGANELRGLKRKGVGSLAVGGESKWIREWSAQVTHFLDKAIPTDIEITHYSHQRLLYITRLVSYLFAEGLLDRTIFLDWYISLLDACTIDRLPLVFTVGLIFLQDISKLRKIARRFSEVLFGKLQMLDSYNLYTTIFARLYVLVIDMLVNDRRSLIQHTSRLEITKSLEISTSKDKRSRLCFLNVAFRLRGVDSTCNPYASIAQDNDPRALVALLDNAQVPEDVREIIERFSSIWTNPSLVKCLGSWAVTPLRAGSYRTYLIAPLLRSAYRTGVFIQDPIMDFLEVFSTNSKGTNTELFFFVSELVRVKVFSVALYLKWLISRGLLTNINIKDEKCPSHIRLLTEIPIHTISPRLRKLRRILLSGCGFNCDLEDEHVFTTKQLLLSKGIYGGHKHSNDCLTVAHILTLQNLTRTVKSEIGLWIRDIVTGLLTPGKLEMWREPPTIKTLQISEWMLIRQVLEAFNDYAVFSEIIKFMFKSDSCDILAFSVEILICNIKSFTALGQMDNFVKTLFSKYKELRQRHTLEKEFILSLLELLSTVYDNASIRTELEKDYLLMDKIYPRSIVPSPMSDGMDILDDEQENHGEIEQLWNGILTIDKYNISRLFETTVSKMETYFEESDNLVAVGLAARRLVKLRQFDNTLFDDLVMGWILRRRHSPNQLSSFRAFSVLIAKSCLRIQTLVDIALEVYTHQKSSKEFKFCAWVLETIICENPFNSTLNVKELFTLKRKRLLFMRASPSQILILFRQTVELCTNSHNVESENHLQRLIISQEVLDLLRMLIPSGLELIKLHLVDPLLKARDSLSIIWLRRLANSIIREEDSNELDDVHVQVARLFNLADEFSVGICKLKMNIIFHENAKLTQPEHAVCGSTIARPFIRGIASVYYDKPEICSDLISVLASPCACQIRADVEDLFLNPSSFLRSRPLLDLLELTADDDHGSGRMLARALSSVMENTSFSVPKKGVNFMPNLLADRLGKLLQSMSLLDYDVEKIDNNIPELPWRSRAAQSELWCWVIVFLRLITVHLPSFMYSKPYITEQVRALFGLTCLLQEDFIQNDELHLEYTLDVAGNFTFGLPDDFRLQLRRFVRGKQPLMMMDFLVGCFEGGEPLRALQRAKVLDFSVKPWERLAEPTPTYGDNDTSISLRLFKTRRSI